MHVTVLSFHSRVFTASTGTLSWPSHCIFCPFHCWCKGQKYVKQSLYKSGHPSKIPGGRGLQMSRPSAHEVGNVFSPTYRPPLSTQEMFLALISVRGWVDSRFVVRSEGLYPWKIAVTLSEIEAATSRLVAQCLNQLHHRVHLHRPVFY
jgi:hypothetical protein